MSSEIPNALYPVVVVQDRYQGVYSGGQWFAIAVADTAECGMSRISWALAFGPSAGDVDAAMFWMGAPDWIAAAATPNAALDALLSRSNPDIPVRPE
jgi:hypothetical protein